MRPPMPELIVYTRRGCHLCELLIEELAPLIRDRVKIEVRDVDAEAAWRDRYGLRVPVIEAEGRTLCEYHLDRARLTAYLDGIETKQQRGARGRL